MNSFNQTILDPPYTDCERCSIRGMSLFKDIQEDRLGWIQSYRKDQILIPARSKIFEEGNKHEFVYTLYSGWGIIYKTVSNNGKRQILRFLLPGDFIGYQANASGVITHSAGTVTKSTLCAFPRIHLKEILKSNPEIALRLLDMQSTNISLCQSHLIATGRKTAKESISFLLLELFYRVQFQFNESFTPSTNSIYFPITQEDIGDALGLTNIHVNRIIKELIESRLIDCHKKKLSILKESQLCNSAGFSDDLRDSYSLGRL